MNSMQVKAKLKNISERKNIDFNLVLKLYVFDRFIERMAKSKYKDNFILKGGFLLSSLFGLENRSTMDIDYAIAKTVFSKENILMMISSIINIDLDDNIKFSINNVSSIRDEDEYGGYRIDLIFKLENVKEGLRVDIATGDPITPGAITYKYKTILNNECLDVWSYNIETVLAEKIETVLSKVEISSRMKDYYDIYLIYKMYWDNVNKDHFKKAVKNTFKKRNFNKNIEETINIIKNSIVLKERWLSYSKRYKYAKDISFEDTLKSIEDIIKATK